MNSKPLNAARRMLASSRFPLRRVHSDAPLAKQAVCGRWLPGVLLALASSSGAWTAANAAPATATAKSATVAVVTAVTAVTATTGSGKATTPASAATVSGKTAATSAAAIRSFSPQGEVAQVRQVKVVFSAAMTHFGSAPGGNDAAPFDIRCSDAASANGGSAAAGAGSTATTTNPASSLVTPPTPSTPPIIIPGAGRWLDERNFVHEFENDLPAGVRCTFAARSGLRSTAGAALTGKTRFQFNTGGPAVVNVLPESWNQLDEEQMFVLVQNGRATPESVLAHAYCAVEGVGERIPVRLVAGADRAALLAQHARDVDPSRVSTLQCQRRLPNGASIKLVWERGIATPSGILTSVAQRYKFEVRKAFAASLSCERENATAYCSPLSVLQLSFNAPVPRKLAQEILFIGADGSQRKAGLDAGADSAEVDSVSFKPPLPANSGFTIRLPRDFRDADGRALENAAEFPLRGRLADYPPLVKFAAAPFGILELNADPVLPLTVRHVEAALPLRSTDGRRGPGVLNSLRLTDDAAIMAWLARLQRFENRSVAVDELPAPGSPGAPLVPAAAVSQGMVQSRAVGLLANEAGVDRRTLPAEAPATVAGKKAEKRPFEVIGIPFTEPGFHVLEVESAQLGAALLALPVPMYVRTSVLVTNLAVHLRLGRENGAVWVTTLDGAKPVSNAEVRVSDCRARLLWHGKTGADGLAMLPSGFDSRCDAAGHDSVGGLFVSARATDASGRGDMAFVLSTWNDGIESYRFNVPTDTSRTATQRVHTVFDRSLLRAGETVSMKHFMRLETLQGFSQADAGRRPNRMRIVHRGSNEEFRFPLAWNGRGSALSQFAIPANAKLGTYEVILDSGPVSDVAGATPENSQDESEHFSSGSFRVEQFRLPLMSGQITPAKGVLVSPKELALGLQLNFLNGGGAAGQTVTVTSLLRDRTKAWPGLEEFSFRHDTGQDAGEDPLRGDENAASAAGEQKIVLDKLAVRLDANGAGKALVKSLPALSAPRQLQNEMTYADPNGEIQTVSQTVDLWPSSVVVGVKTGEWAAVRRKLSLTAVTLDTGGRPQAGVSVDVLGTSVQYNSVRKRLVGGFYGYESRRVNRPLGKLCSGTSDKHGLVRCEVSLQESGNVEVTARARDSAGHLSMATASAWLTAAGDTWFDQQNQDRIEVLPEKKQYEAGETAVFQVRMPFREATALVAVEREGIVETRVVQISARDPVIRLPVKASYGPNVYVSVLALRARVREVPWYSFFSWGWKQPLSWWGEFRDSAAAGAAGPMVDLAKPAFKFGLAEIAVGSAGHRLDVRVSADRATYPVRGKARVSVAVKLPDGRPAAGAHIALAAVDEALLELQPNRSWDLLAAMLKRRAYGMETATAQMQVIGKRHFGRKAVPAGGGGGRSPTRELFDTLLLWRGDIALDAAGRAEIEVPLNDTLSSFRLVAVADDGPGLFGHGMSSVRTTQDLQLISGLPPLVREGDRYTAMTTLRNTTARTMEVDVTATVSGVDAAAMAGLPPQRLTLAAGQMRELAWQVTAPPLAPTVATGPATVLPGTATGATPASLAQGSANPAGKPATGGQLSWEIVAQERGVNVAGAGSRGMSPTASPTTTPARDAIRVNQRLIAAVPVSVRQATLLQLDRSASLALAPPRDGLPGRGGLTVMVTPSLVGALAGVQSWFAAYPYSCLEQKASRAIALRDPVAWARLMDDLPSYLDGDGLAYFYPSRPDAGGADGSDVLTSYLLTAAHESGQAIPQASRERMLRGLAAFVEGRIMRNHWAPSNDLAVRKLAALDALARYGQAQARLLGSIELTPALWPTSALLDWMSILTRVQGIDHSGERLAEVDNILRARLSYQGTRTVFSTEKNDAWWWMMTGADVNASRLLLAVLNRPGWREDLPQLASGALGRQVRGHWGTTTANLWGTLALQKFSAQFESTPVSGTTRASLGDPGKTGKAASAVTASGSGSFARPAGSAAQASWMFPWTGKTLQTLSLMHEGSGRPWVTLLSSAAVPLTQPVASGYRLRRSVQIEGRTGVEYARGDIVRVEVEIDASADMTAVVVSDPLPAGATVLGSGLGRDSSAGAVIGAPSNQVQAAAPAFEERAFDSLRSYYTLVPKGKLLMRYRLRLNNAGVFQLPPTRVEAMYAPEMFGEAPNAVLTVK